jgi:aspartate racemase
MEALVQTRSHIGIVAGTAEGASLCYRSLCHEAEHLVCPHAHPEITMHTFPLALYLDLIERDDWTGVATLMSRSAAKLVRAGAELIICPNNTMHRAFDLVVSAVPWLHIVATVEAEIRRRALQRVGLIGTLAVMEGPIYHPRLVRGRIDVVLPEPPERIRLQHIIRTELIQGQYLSTSRACVQDIIAGLAAKGAEAVILGCTELPLLLSENESALPLLDSTCILARGALQCMVQARQNKLQPHTDSTTLLTSFFH